MRFSSSRNLFLAALALACIAGVILVVLLHWDGTANQPSDSAPSAADATAKTASTITSTIANLLDIPLYPDAQNVEGDPLNDSVDLYAHTAFTSTAPRDDVLDFYEKLLLAKGWLLDDRPLGYASPEDIRRFRWFDSSGISPHALTMAVYISKNLLSDDSGPRFYIEKHKWPDIYYRPLYPDATEAQTADSILTPEYYSFFRVITTTYTTNTDLKMLESYYTPIMTGLGCQPFTPYGYTYPLDMTGNHSEYPDFGYRCDALNAPQRPWGFAMTLKIRPHEGKRSTVEMVSRGVDAGDRNKP